MPATAENPVTIERFQKGKTWKQYIESGIRNRELFEDNYNGLTISEAQAKRLKALAANPKGPHHVVVIGEDWCPDVYRGTGIAQKVAETMGIEMRFFERDQNKDMIQPYLKDGEFESIPVFVFFDKDHKEILHFIERPALANEQLHVTRDVLGDTSPEGIAKKLGHEPSEAELKAEREKAREKYMEWQKGPVWAGWRDATVDELADRLEKAL
jgi:Thioredoxin